MCAKHKMTPTGFEGDSVTSCNNSMLHHFQNFDCAKTCASFDNSMFLTLSNDDRQALETLVSVWSKLSQNAKLHVFQVLECDLNAMQAEE